MRGRTLGLLVLGVVVLGVVIRMLWLCPGRTEKGPLHQSGFQAKRPGLRPPPVCKAGDTTPRTELVKQVPKGELHSPYPDYMKLAEDDPDLVKQFRLPGWNECHGGSGGGGICPALTLQPVDARPMYAGRDIGCLLCHHSLGRPSQEDWSPED